MTSVSRRGFLTGSSFFAAALAMAATARAQDPAKQDPAPKPSPTPEPRKGPKTDEEIFAEQERARTELVDDQGREYRICPQCGFHMFRQGQAWVCSNCGFSYIE